MSLNKNKDCLNCLTNSSVKDNYNSQALLKSSVCHFRTTTVSKSIHSALEKYSARTSLLSPGSLSCLSDVLPPAFAQDWSEWSDFIYAISKLQLFCRGGDGNVSGDLINTWRLCKPFTPYTDNSQLASNWNFKAIFYVY